MHLAQFFFLAFFVFSFQNYHQHMMGKRHQAMMSHIMEVAEAKTAEALKNLRAEGHVDRIRRG